MLTRQIDGLHAQIGGGYAMGPKIVIDAAELAPGQIEIMALDETTGDELERATATNESDARRIFCDMIQRHAEPMQRAFARADMQPGQRYTLFHLGEFGFPIAQRFTFHKMELTTYAQHRDAIRLTLTPAGKRTPWEQYVLNRSFILCAGWQRIDEAKIKNTLTDTPEVKTTISKYACFDYRYIEDAERYLENIIVVHKDYKTGANGRQYA